VAIGAAVRRLFPDLKIMLLTGFKQTDALIGPITLDWIKLPSYEKIMVGGRTQSRVGYTNLKNSVLVQSRARLIQAITVEYRPRCVLVDHEARGKRDELLEAVKSSAETIWVLGVRGIIGQVEDVWAPGTIQFFKKYYSALIWYGDDRVLGHKQLEKLQNRYGMQPRVAGYVSRLKEIEHWRGTSTSSVKEYAGTIAIPWDSNASVAIVHTIHEVLTAIGDQFGTWHLFLKSNLQMFDDLPFCIVQKPGPGYLETLLHSKIAIIYGGYNSITDVLVTNTPSIIFLRGFDDLEQQEHVAMLAADEGTSMIVFDENSVDAVALKDAMVRMLRVARPDSNRLELNGAEETARIIVELLDENC
jgi:predicted glycosyltransferase